MSKIKDVVKIFIGDKHYQNLKRFIGREHKPDYGNNTVVNSPVLLNSRIEFDGHDNILYFEQPNMIFRNSDLMFKGNGAVVYISAHSNKERPFRLRIFSQNNTVVYIGQNTNFHIGKDSVSHIMPSEGKNIIIGNDCLFSLNTWFRTSDGHSIYSSKTHDRINPARSIFIGDHVWFGQDTTILKNSRVGSGSIVGAGSILTGKSYTSNSSIAGIPAKVLSSDIFFTKQNVSTYDAGATRNTMHKDTDEWIYSYDKDTLDFDTIDAALLKAKTSKAKLKYIQEHIAGERAKNRFYVGEENTPVKKSK